MLLCFLKKNGGDPCKARRMPTTNHSSSASSEYVPVGSSHRQDLVIFAKLRVVVLVLERTNSRYFLSKPARDDRQAHEDCGQ